MNSLGTIIWSLVFLAVCPVGGWAQGEMKKVSRAEAIAATQSKVQPEYPPLARQLKVQGAVELEAVVSEDGTVEKVNILSGNPVLTKPASEALKKWKFKPFVSEGKPVKALAPVSFDFSL
jgi:periplasmic protein TonB